MPQACTWNIGVSGMYTSSRVSVPWPPAAFRPASTPSVCSTSWRCEYQTPFGAPVVPVV